LRSVFIGAHDGEHARRLLGISGIFGAALQVRRVIVDLEEVGDAGDIKITEVVLAVWVVVGRE
jgi:hypothetical protein